MRELIGKKVKTNLRKDLDDESERIKIKLFSCRRQFDNLRRIYKGIVKCYDAANVGPTTQLADLIKSQFQLEKSISFEICYYCIFMLSQI